MKMEMIVGVLGIAVLAGCSSSASRPVFDSGDSGSSSSDLTNFLGTWTGTDTVTVMCDGGITESTNGTVSFGLSESGSGLTYTSVTGCVLDFTVSGDTATLSNAPVTCSDTTDAGTVVTTVTSYTLSTSDGQHLTGTYDTVEMIDGIDCTGPVTFSATR
jgi:hypothetical protein